MPRASNAHREACARSISRAVVDTPRGRWIQTFYQQLLITTETDDRRDDRRDRGDASHGPARVHAHVGGDAREAFVGRLAVMLSGESTNAAFGLVCDGPNEDWVN